MQKYLRIYTARLLGAAALGALCVTGFAPFYIYPASILSLIGLIFLLRHAQTTKQAALTGFAYGLGLFGVGIYWIYISLHVYGNMPGIMAALATFLLAAFLALFPAAVCALSKKLPPHSSIAFAVMWALSDWIRSWIFTGFPWLTIGYSQIPNSPLAAYAPVFGIYGVSFLTVLIAGLGCKLLIKQSEHKLRTGMMLLAVILGGALLNQIEWTKPSTEATSVSLLQGNIDQSIKWEPDIAERTLQLYQNMIEQSNARLIILPETAMPVLSNNIPQSTLDAIRQHGLKNNSDILIGVVERENGEFFNSVLSFGSSQTGVYRKSHLVPFGEFIPFKAVFGWIYRDWLQMPLSDLSRGSITQQPMPVAGQKVAVNICYEDVFGEEIIRQLPQATLLVNVSNDAWYGESYAADQHMQFSQARALETGRMMLRATNTGATAIIDAKGKLLAHAPHFTQTTVEGNIYGYSGSTPYVYWGNWPFIIISMLLLITLRRRDRFSETK